MNNLPPASEERWLVPRFISCFPILTADDSILSIPEDKLDVDADDLCLSDSFDSNWTVDC